MSHTDRPRDPTEHLLRLMYLSTATATDDGGSIQSILRASSVHNPLSGITGLLCSSRSHFLQVIEGPEQAVIELYGRVAKDPRHRDPVLLSIELVADRLFAGWSMAHIEGDGHADELYRTLLPRRHADPGKQAVAALMRSFIDTLNAKQRTDAPHR
ncbi:MAG TPA: BLUF domain-containing protein [Methylibium sp.]|nr:BLUF domain-containing protein [Methylibium sp.]